MKKASGKPPIAAGTLTMRGYHSAEICRAHGWTAGTVLESRTGGELCRIRLTAIGPRTTDD